MELAAWRSEGVDTESQRPHAPASRAPPGLRAVSKRTQAPFRIL